MDPLAVDEVDDRLELLAESLSLSEDEVPSIDTPVAHEQAIEAEQRLQATRDLEHDSPQHENTTELEPDHEFAWEL